MADVKISQLPAATTPLAGTEQIPLVQSSTTKQITVSNLLTAANLGTPTAINLTNATNVPVNQATGILPVANGGNGTATPSIVGGTNISVSGTWPNQTISATGAASGNVTGPSSATDNAVVRFDNTTGQVIQNSNVIINDTGEITAGAWKATPVAVAYGGTGTTTPSLVAGTNVTISGTWPNQTINSSGGSGGVTSVTGTAPVVSSGGTTPAISMAAATTSVSGYLTSTDWNTFNNKQPAGSYLTSGGALGTPSSGTATNLTGLPLSTGVTGTLPVANGGTGTTTPSIVAGTNVTVTGTWPNQTINSSGGGSMTYPGAGIANSTGSAWGTSYSTSGSGTVIPLATGASLTTPTQTSYENWTGISAPAYTEGRTWYDSGAHALAYYNDSANAVVHVGQDLQVKVINNTGSTIANGSPVYITGTSSGQTYPNIALAKADVAGTSAVIGLTNGAITNGSIGYVTSQGGIDNVNTGSFTVGQVLYLSPYSAGQLMNTLPPTGITVQVGVVSYVDASAGKIYVKQTTPLAVPASIITGAVAIANGGTGQTTAAAAITALTGTQTSAYYLRSNGTNASLSALSAADLTGTVAIASGGSGQTTAQTAMNAFAGAVTSGSYLRGNGTNVVMATIQAADVPTLNQNTTGTSANVTGTVAVANGGTGQTTANTAFNALAPSQSTNSGKYLTTDGTNTSWATVAAGASVSTANTWTATQTFNGSSSTFGAVLTDTAETVNVVGSAPSATTNLYVQSGSVQYYTSNAANNFVVNLAFSSGTSMNTALATGQSVTAALVTTQGSTAYYATSIQVDGTTSGVTTKWIGGAPTAGNASGLDVYRFSIIKTASATYTVLASLTQFK